MDLKLGLLTLVVLLWGCRGEVHNKPDVPVHISKLENLTVYAPDIQPEDTVELIKEVVFESGEDSFMEGFISSLGVDDFGRVYIGSGTAGRAGIYVFRPDGSFLTRIGRAGRGPGEFKSIASVVVWKENIYLFDPVLQKFGVFSTMDYKLKGEAMIQIGKAAESDSLVHRLRGYRLVVGEDGELFLDLRMFAQSRDQDINNILYYRLSSDGVLLPGRVLDIPRFPFYFSKNNVMKFPFTMPFTRSSLVSVTNEGKFYTAWTEDFLIKVYDGDGEYMRAFYYPLQKSSLSLDELDINRDRKIVLSKYNLPETWPILHTMELDDAGNLWVATITDSEDSFTWWVLDQDGELVARFSLPGERASRKVMSKPLIEIKNGYFYTHEFDFHAGIDRIVKYRIVFKKI